MPDAVLFDLDGTLVDTAPDMVRVLNDMMVDRGVEPLPYDRVRSFVSNGSLGLVRLGFPHAAESALRDLQTDYLNRYAANVCEASDVFPDLGELLDRLEDARIPWGVVTNKPQRMTEPLLDALGLTDRAACVVCGDTLPQRKPNPAPLIHAAREAGVAADRSIYVGDASRDIEAGRAAGMLTIAVGYGYIVDGDDYSRWGADAVAPQTTDLVQLIVEATGLDAQ